ncbi:hypothetical protein IKD49_02235 [Candidatus Saccharibacteria bacterium]|nr:hypothetical protein [Candidatus Saccharibacteria bacterium]
METPMKHFLKAFIIPLFVTPILLCSFLVTPSVSAIITDCDSLKEKVLIDGATPEERDTYFAECDGSQNTKPNSASGTTPSSASSSFVSSSCGDFLGMPSWNCNVTINTGDDGESLKSGIWTIAANIATDITVIAAYLVVCYIIYGGYLYMFSNGDTGKVATGKKAIHQALLGLAIVISANVILNGIRIGLGAANLSENCIASGGCVEPGPMVTSALQWVIGIAGVISAIFIVMSGTSYIMSRGDPNKIQTAKQTITYALIGLAIVALAELIVTFASNIINNANDTAYINQNTISKEYHEN